MHDLGTNFPLCQVIRYQNHFWITLPKTLVTGWGPHVTDTFTATSLHCTFPEASAVSAMRSLKSLDGKAQTESNYYNAERDMRRKFKSLGYSLPIKVHATEHECFTPETKSLTTYHITPQQWVEHWMNECPKLLGGHTGCPHKNFEAFWTLYKVHHPSHDVFTHHGDHLGRVVPILIHGDEGRAVKRTNYLVLSMETPFGSILDPSLSCACATELGERADLPSFDDNLAEAETLPDDILQTARAQSTNYKGHSYLSKFLLFGLGAWVYKKHTHIVDALLEEIRKGMDILFNQGITLNNGKVIFASLVGIKGDMSFHRSIFNLSRSYSNVGTVNHNKICHCCEAGEEGCSFEDFSEEPTWSRTLYSTRPWPQDMRPTLSKIAFDESAPEQMLRNDFFHIYKLGVARDVIGGIVVILARLKYFDHENCSKSIDSRLARAHSYFSLWASAEGRCPALRSFSMAFFNLKSLSSAPWVNCKGSDARLLLEWLDFQLRLFINYPPFVDEHGRLLRTMQLVVEACLSVYMIHRHPLWLERMCARNLYIKIMRVLRGYASLASQVIPLQMRAFVMKPKQHGFHHIAWALKQGLLTGAALIPSPQLYGTEGNEDYVGRISRLSRRVCIRVCDLRVCDRLFLKTTALLRRRALKKSRWVKRRKFRKARK